MRKINDGLTNKVRSYRRNPEKHKLASLKHYHTNKININKKKKNYLRGWALHKKYGISSEEYNQLFEQQQGKCVICDSHQSELNKALHVDHNHDTGLIRGLLCFNCNAGLGNFKDDQNLLEKAKSYLERTE